MRIMLTALAVVAVVAAVATPAAADGGRRVWRGSGYGGIGAISRNVITPWYVGYHGGHYNYYKPDPMPAPVYWVYPGGPDCWLWAPYGHRIWVC
jgi:hypothetical protein